MAGCGVQPGSWAVTLPEVLTSVRVYLANGHYRAIPQLQACSKTNAHAATSTHQAAAMNATLLQSSSRCAARPVANRSRKHASVSVYATNWDPENLFKGTAPKTGIIERRLMQKQVETDKDFAKAVAMARDEDQKQVMFRRQSRTPPTDHIELVEYFLNTQADDMEVSTHPHSHWYNLMRVRLSLPL